MARESEARRLSGAVVGILAEDHDAYPVERRQRHRVEDERCRRLEPPSGLDLVDEEAAELLHCGVSSSSPGDDNAQAVEHERLEAPDDVELGVLRHVVEVVDHEHGVDGVPEPLLRTR